MKIKSVLPLEELTAITPLDGRYRNKTAQIAEYISEFALVKTRIEVEAKYLIALSKAKVIRSLSKKEQEILLAAAPSFTLRDAQKVKEIEKSTRHDVKAMERFFRNKMQKTPLADLIEMIHFGLTSEDVNNIAYRLMLTRASENILTPVLSQIVDSLSKMADDWRAVPMLARTHGQAAVPTTLGKEISVFLVRLGRQLASLKEQKLTGKLNGAVGNFNALKATYPNVDWMRFSKTFIASFNLFPNLITTQINTYDDIAEYFQNYQRINNVLIDFAQDAWRYISDGWFVQEIKKGEVGSSTMPQKVNPIDFENAEGNLGTANALLEFMARKLAVSRLQRDLSDSTVLRNIGTVFGFCLVGYLSIGAGVSRIRPDFKKINYDLESDWAILAEGIQTILRKSGVSDPYSLISSLSHGQQITKDDWGKWLNLLPIEDKYKVQLLKLSPKNYIGYAEALTKKAVKEVNRR